VNKYSLVLIALASCRFFSNSGICCWRQIFD